MSQAARRWARRLLILVLVSANAVVSASADQRYVGVWHGETADSGQVRGLPFNRRRWIKVVTQDGTAQTTYRYYLDSTFQAEDVEWHQWGFDSRGTYWEQCMFVRNDTGMHNCGGAARAYYSVQAFDGREFRYTSMASGKNYLMTMVPRDFTFGR